MRHGRLGRDFLRPCLEHGFHGIFVPRRAWETRGVDRSGPPCEVGCAGRQAESLSHGPRSGSMRRPSAPNRNHTFKLSCAPHLKRIRGVRPRSFPSQFPGVGRADVLPERHRPRLAPGRRLRLNRSPVIQPKSPKPTLVQTGRNDLRMNMKKGAGAPNIFA